VGCVHVHGHFELPGRSIPRSADTSESPDEAALLAGSLPLLVPSSASCRCAS
jgi:hypothetical protein